MAEAIDPTVQWLETAAEWEAAQARGEVDRREEEDEEDVFAVKATDTVVFDVRFSAAGGGGDGGARGFVPVPVS
jgi:hypothetical protein